MLWAHRSRGSRLPTDSRCAGMTPPDAMRAPWARWRAVSAVLILLWGRPHVALACPQPCACYVPSEVHCTFRSLPSVPAGISPHVERINLGFNSIQALSETSFAGLTKLELLMVHGNDIPSIPDGALRDLISLQVFKFSYNKLRVITGETLQGLWNLVRLHMDHNQIEFIHPEAFRGLTSLRLLHLEGNLLRQLHPATFSTFAFLDYFRLSTVRHLYLAENALSRLPAGMLQNMPLLENLYLHGNPWACDCDMAWLLEWDARYKGVLKCKKDKAYEGGQLCSTCFSPNKWRQRELQRLQDVPCQKPSIESPLRHNGSRSSEEDRDEHGDARLPLSPDGFQVPAWNVSVNMSDEHGNTVHLVCDIKKPTDVSRLQLNQTDPQEIEINATVALDFECPMTRQNYEKLWKLIAYYSEVPVKLHRDPTPGKDPRLGHQYRQDADDAATLYYTGVRAHIVAEPEWVTQPSIELQLNRRLSSANVVVLSYSSWHALVVSAKDARLSQSRSWVMIEPGKAVQRAQTVLEGSPCQLSCNVRASESPSISWVLPDGSVVKAPMEDRDGRFSVLTSGWLKIRSTQPSDAGLYQCVARVRDETDHMLYRLLVQPPVVQPPDAFTVTVHKNPGEPVTLPCTALAVPEAQISWILPHKRMLNAMANASHAYVLADGTLSIPKVQGRDSGYYRCVAVNQQGADHFTVGVQVSKRGSGGSPKRGGRPGGRTVSGGRGGIVEDEGGSGMGDEENASRTALHPQDQEVLIRATDDAVGRGTKTRKGRRKLKPWKHPAKEPETNVAEGRRVFESRRRINVANKQINPERWADILARVRGRTLPKGTEGPQVITVSSPSLTRQDATPPLPAVAPGSAPIQTTSSAEESSGDTSVFGEEERVSSTVSSPRTVPLQPGHDGVIGSEPRVTRAPVEEYIEEDSSEKTLGTTPTEVDSNQTPAITPSSILYEFSTLQALEMEHKGPTSEKVATDSWSTLDVGSVPESASPEDESPMDAVPLAESETVTYFYPDLGTNPLPAEHTVKEQASAHFTPTPVSWVAEARTPEPLEDPTLGGRDVPAKTRLQEQTDSPQLVKTGLSTPGHRVIPEGMKETSQTLQEVGTLGTHPTDSRHVEGNGQAVDPTTPLDLALQAVNSVTDLKRPRESPLGVVFGKDTTTAVVTTPGPRDTSPSALTTHPSRKRPHGRRRFRPHKFRHRHKQTPHTTFAPTDTVSAPPTQVPEVKTASQGASSLGPTTWANSAVGTPGRLDTEEHAEPVSRGSPRRKQGNSPNRHRYIASTLSSAASVSKPSLSPEDKTWKAALSPTTVSFTTGDPRELTGLEDYSTASISKTHLSRDRFREAVPVTREPGSDGKEMNNHRVTDLGDYQTVGVVPGSSVTHAVSPSGAKVSPTRGFKEASLTSPFPETTSWDPPGASRPAMEQTDLPVTSPSEALTESPSVREAADLGLPTEFLPSAGVSTLFQPQQAAPSTTLPVLKVEASSSPAETTVSDQRSRETAHATVPSEIRPQSRVSTPAPVEEPEWPFPATILTSSAETTTEPTPLLPSGTSPAWKASKEHVSFHYVGTPETKAPLVNNEVTRHLAKPDQLSTPSSKQDKFTLTPEEALRKEAFDGTMKNMLPRAPDGPNEAGRVPVFHQPAGVPATPIPPRGTVRPLHAVTQSPLRHSVTFQPPLHLTRKPGVTAYLSRVWPEGGHMTTPRSTSYPTTPEVVSWPGSKPSVPGPATGQGTDRFQGNSRSLGNNHLPDLRRDPVGKLPNSRVPPFPGRRFPFFINRTLSFPQLGGTPKPHGPSSPAPALRDRKVNTGPYTRIHAQSIFHMDLGPPAPPVLHAPRTTATPSTNVRNIPPVSSTRSSVPFTTSSVPPSRSFHHSSSKLFSAGGPPASKFWTLGEKPQIVTKSPQTVTVTAETDVMFPCEATGKPKPFVTWTKLSTGALMTPNTRLQRFEVLKNGTFVIRSVQVQDRGQYMCTAKNLHGADRMVVLLSVTVQQPQILASHYKDVTVYLGDTIAMECLAKGTPAPQISWVFPDGRVWQTVSPVEGRVTLHENRTLSIKEASFQDRGVYKCVASNAAGADSLAIRLHVAALPPVIHQEKAENISLPPGLSIHIHCTARAAPLPSVRWVLRDGTQIRPSQFVHGNLFVFPNGTLYIRNLAPQDSGRYECVAANLVGSARRTVLLTVQRAAANARITGTSPQRTDVRYGGTLRLDCSASGDPWPRIVWRLPSKRMIDALFSFDTRIKAFANGTLVVKSVTDKDAGDYLCVARNKVGDDFVALKVNVVMKAAKIQRKEAHDHRVVSGGDLKVDCLAAGLPNPDISWGLPDGSLVHPFVQADDSGGRAKRYVVFHNGTLYFNEVGPREEGDYTCFAENQFGKDEMRVRVKVVSEPAAIRNKTYSVIQVPYGDVVSVACEAQGEPAPSVTWLSPSHRRIPAASDKYQVHQDGTLLIQKAQRSDSGNYTCVVRNSGGEDRKTVRVHVHVQPPTINGFPEAVSTVREAAPGGSRKLIHCRAEGVPAPRVLWAFPEGVVLPAPYHGNRITIHRNGTLDIKSLRTSDSVQLACIGRNEGGEARLLVQLTVLQPLAKPVFHDPVSEKITAAAGHTISLNCSAAGTPPPALLWVLPNGTELRSGQRLHRFFHKGDGRLHVSALSPEDAGAYRCVASNSAGRAERLVSLKVGLQPAASKRFQNLVSIVHGETLRLPCAPGARGTRPSWTLPSGLVLHGAQVRGRFALWDNGTLTVRDASVFDRGTYVCNAQGEHGPAAVSVPVIVIAYPPRITSEPTPVIYARPGSTVSINCTAMGVPKADISWELPDKSHLAAGTQPRLYGNRFLHPQGSLTVQQASPRDAGFYRCTAKNLLGSDSKTTYVHIY